MAIQGESYEILPFLVKVSAEEGSHTPGTTFFGNFENFTKSQGIYF